MHSQSRGRLLLVPPRRIWRRADGVRHPKPKLRRLGFLLSGVVHRLICQPVGVSVLLAAHVFETDTSNLVREKAGFGMERLESRMLDFVVAEHLLNEQQRIGSNVNDA